MDKIHCYSNRRRFVISGKQVKKSHRIYTVVFDIRKIIITSNSKMPAV